MPADVETLSEALPSSTSPPMRNPVNASPAAQRVVDDTPFELEFGDTLEQLEIAYECWGELSPAKDNAILICPSFSGHSHAQSQPADPTPGWWEGLIGRGLAFDTDKYFVLCPSLLGGACGTTGPRSIDPATGLPYGERFPTIGVRDIVAVHVRLLDHLGIDRLFAVAGGSLGAMQTVELGIRLPHRVARVVSFAGTDRTRPYTAAIHHLGRRILRLGRDAGDDLGNEGLRLARELGTLFYRSRTEFNQRFDWSPIHRPSRDRVTFDVQSYLEYQGLKAVGKFDFDAYSILSMAMDLHDVWKDSPSPEAALETVSAKFFNVSAEEDHLIPMDEQQDFHQRLLAAGKKSHWCSLPSIVGHDSFLVEIEQVGQLVETFLADSIDTDSFGDGGAI